MSNGNYNYKITTEELASPRDELSKFVARVGMITENLKNRFNFHQPRLGDVYGKTEKEAIEKMEIRIANWIKKP